MTNKTVLLIANMIEDHFRSASSKSYRYAARRVYFTVTQ